ncbi:MAG: hypothetical protein ACRDDH_03600 [Cetobacterium sp.]|uniref:hypothetical protein n=1 Tax=Cetobacterium sp. TaxID=2071632 RepID=UPI003EE5DEC5
MDALKGNLRNFVLQLIITFILLRYNVFKFEEKFLKDQIITLKYSLIVTGGIFLIAIIVAYFVFPLTVEIKQKNKVYNTNETRFLVDANTNSVTTSNKERQVEITIKIKRNKSIFDIIYYFLIKIFNINIFIIADGFVLTPDRSIYIEDCMNNGIKINLYKYIINNVDTTNTRDLKFFYQINEGGNLGDDIPIKIRISFYENLLLRKQRIKNRIIKVLLKLNKIEEHTIRYIRNR